MSRSAMYLAWLLFAILASPGCKKIVTFEQDPEGAPTTAGERSLEPRTVIAQMDELRDRVKAGGTVDPEELATVEAQLNRVAKGVPPESAIGLMMSFNARIDKLMKPYNDAVAKADTEHGIFDPTTWTDKTRLQAHVRDCRTLAALSESTARHLRADFETLVARMNEAPGGAGNTRDVERVFETTLQIRETETEVWRASLDMLTVLQDRFGDWGLDADGAVEFRVRAPVEVVARYDHAAERLEAAWARQAVLQKTLGERL